MIKATLFSALTLLCTTLSAQTKFKISLANIGKQDVVSGKLYIIMTGDLSKEEIFYTSPINNEIIMSADVTFKGNQPVVIGPELKVSAFPFPMNKIPDGAYKIAAVIDTNRIQRHYAYSEGNIYSEAVIDTISAGAERQIPLILNQVYHRNSPPETEFIKLLKIRSSLLSAHNHIETFVNAGVVLPPSYYVETNKKFPVVYVLPEFDNSHYDAFHIQEYLTRYKGIEKIYVVLDPLCDYGNHVFADSQNNGPRATSLVTEVIPNIEKEFRILGNNNSRFLFGHSSGGWAALWLQLNYPDYFTAAFATSPDPVDFRCFYKINIYDSTSNVFLNEDGSPRVFDRIPLDPLPQYKMFSDFENVVKGEQLQSHESVFSGRFQQAPKQLWNRESGKLDPIVVAEWEQYDIRKLIEKRSAKLAPKVNNKLFIYCGANDEFYLNDAVALLSESLKTANIVAEIKTYSDRGHSDVFADDVLDQIDFNINSKLSPQKSIKK